MVSGLPYHAMQMVRDVQNREKYGASGGEKGRGILTDIKVSELPTERIDEFSNAPFEFEETAKWLWEDTQTTYYHACTENRFSENYLKLCAQLEKNIKRDTEKRKKLLEDNRMLSYNALCERYNCDAQELLDIIMREHDQAEMLRASGVSENDLFDLCDKKSSENGKSSESDADEDQMSFYDNE